MRTWRRIPSAGRATNDLSFGDQLHQSGQLPRRAHAQAELPLQLRQHVGLSVPERGPEQLRVDEPVPLEPAVDVGGADEADEEVRRRVVADTHHQREEIANRQAQPRVQVLEDAGAVDLRLRREDDLLVLAEAALRHLVEDLDHHGGLDGAGRREAPVGVDEHGRAGGEALGGDAHDGITALQPFGDAGGEGSGGLRGHGDPQHAMQEAAALQTRLLRPSARPRTSRPPAPARRACGRHDTPLAVGVGYDPRRAQQVQPVRLDPRPGARR